MKSPRDTKYANENCRNKNYVIENSLARKKIFKCLF